MEQECNAMDETKALKRRAQVFMLTISNLDLPVGQLPLSSVSTHVFRISEKGAQFHPKPRT